MGILGRLKHSWNAFTDQDDKYRIYAPDMGASYGIRPDRSRLYVYSERSIIASIYTRLGIDVAAVDIRHVRLDEDGRYQGDIDSGLHNCLTLEANVDQAARAFRQDICRAPATIYLKKRGLPF